MSHWQSAQLARSYSAFRPRYPARLFHDVVAAYEQQSSRSSTAVALPSLIIDLGSGSGQAIQGLLENGNFSDARASTVHHFVALDPSAAQLREAEATLSPLLSDKPHCRLTIVCGDAGAADMNPLLLPDLLLLSGKDTASTTSSPPPLLVTSAQALHWMSIPNVCKNLEQLAQQRGRGESIVFAVWNYNTVTIQSSSPASNTILQAFDRKLTDASYWPPERMHVDNDYRLLAAELETCRFRRVFPVATASSGSASADTACWSRTDDPRQLPLSAFVNYLSTWSGVQRYVKQLNKTNNDSTISVASVLEEEVAKPIRALEQGGHDPLLTLNFRFNLHVFSNKPEPKTLKSNL